MIYIIRKITLYLMSFIGARTLSTALASKYGALVWLIHVVVIVSVFLDIMEDCNEDSEYT